MNLKIKLMSTAFCVLFICNFASAQEKNIAEKAYTYEEAKQLLLDAQSEFTIKGEAEAIPKIGIQINRARTTRGVTTQKLAELTGLQNKHITKIESGNLYPTRDIILIIEEYLDTEIILDAEGF